MGLSAAVFVSAEQLKRREVSSDILCFAWVRPRGSTIRQLMVHKGKVPLESFD
jgi:hypothetical protein